MIDRETDFRELIGDVDEPAAIPGIVGGAELSEILGIAERQIAILAEKGILRKVGRAKFKTRESIVGYIRARKANSELEAEKIKLTQQQTEKIEIQNAVARRELLPAGDVEEGWAAILRDLRAAFLALSTRIGQRLPHLSAHDLAAMDLEIRAVMTDLATEDFI